eukprot:COSAG05_NODE_4905_length_1331_cov_2.918182_2_plen_251_part_01
MPPVMSQQRALAIAEADAAAKAKRAIDNAVATQTLDWGLQMPVDGDDRSRLLAKYGDALAKHGTCPVAERVAACLRLPAEPRADARDYGIQMSVPEREQNRLLAKYGDEKDKKQAAENEAAAVARVKAEAAAEVLAKAEAARVAAEKAEAEAAAAAALAEEAAALRRGVSGADAERLEATYGDSVKTKETRAEKTARQLAEAAELRLQKEGEMFRMLDKDGDGLVTVQEVVEGLGVSEKEAAKILRKHGGK